MEELVLAFASLELAPIDAADPHAAELREYYEGMTAVLVDGCLTAQLEVRRCRGPRQRRGWWALDRAPTDAGAARGGPRQDVLFSDVYDRYVECELTDVFFRALEGPLLADRFGSTITPPVANGAGGPGGVGGYATGGLMGVPAPVP